MKAVWTAKISDPQAKLVLLKIADCANDAGICWPYVSTIAEETELSDRTVRRKLELLESAGWLVRDRVKNGVTYQIKTPSRGDTVTGPGVTGCQSLNGKKDPSRGDTVTGGDTVTDCQADRSGVTHRPVGGDTVTVTINREPSRTTIEPPLKSASDAATQAQAIVDAYPRKQKVALSLEIVAKDLQSGISFETMLAGTKACAEAIKAAPSGALNRYVPSAESFFRDKRWQDDPATIIRPPETETNGKKPLIVAGRLVKS